MRPKKYCGLKGRAPLHKTCFDTYDRINGVTNGDYSVGYTYVPNSDLISTATFKSNSTTVLTTTKSWDFGYRLRSIQNLVGGVPVSGHAYLYDEIDRRVQATLADGSRWKYDYNDRNEVTSGKRFWSDFIPVSGQQYTYQYDSIGNRLTSFNGGNDQGANLRKTAYQINSLNQYTAVTNSEYAQIIGAASAPASVTVNGSGAYEKGEYFHKELSALGSNPVSLSVAAIASYSGSTATNSGSLLLPPDRTGPRL